MFLNNRNLVIKIAVLKRKLKKVLITYYNLKSIVIVGYANVISSNCKFHTKIVYAECISRNISEGPKGNYISLNTCTKFI